MAATDRPFSSSREASMRPTSVCIPVALTDWAATPDAAMRADAVAGLERGDVVLFPHLPFALTPDEQKLLDAGCVKDGTKTVKYDPDTGRAWGAMRTPLAGCSTRLSPATVLR